MKKILYLAVVSAGLFLTSCSMNHDVASLKTQKLQAAQTLVTNHQSQQVAVVPESKTNEVTPNNSIDLNATNKTADISVVNTGSPLKRVKNHVANDYKKKGSNYAFTSLVNPKNISERAANLVKIKTKTASAQSSSHTLKGGNLYKALVFLLVSLVLFILAALLGGVVGSLFYIIASIVFVVAVVFFIFWLLEMAG